MSRNRWIHGGVLLMLGIAGWSSLGLAPDLLVICREAGECAPAVSLYEACCDCQALCGTPEEQVGRTLESGCDCSDVQQRVWLASAEGSRGPLPAVLTTSPEAALALPAAIFRVSPTPVPPSSGTAPPVLRI